MREADCYIGISSCENWFDDKLIRKDGEFVLDELKTLNSEKLK